MHAFPVYPVKNVPFYGQLLRRNPDVVYVDRITGWPIAPAALRKRGENIILLTEHLLGENGLERHLRKIVQRYRSTYDHIVDTVACKLTMEISTIFAMMNRGDLKDL